MQTYGGVRVLLHALLISAVDGDEWLASRPSRFNHEKRTHACMHTYIHTYTHTYQV
jgi:hypothetical protein